MTVSMTGTSHRDFASFSHSRHLATRPGLVGAGKNLGAAQDLGGDGVTLVGGVRESFGLQDRR